MAVFASRQIVMPAMPAKVAVTITGTGNSRYCYAMINGTKQYSAGTHEVYTGDTITFGVYGMNNTGWLKIDGTKVLESSNGVKTYDWIVPDGVSTVEIAMTYLGSACQITVTTA